MATGGVSSFLGGFAGSTIGSAVVRLSLDSKAYQAGLAKTEAQTTGVTGKTQKFGQYAALAWAAAGTAVISFAADSVRAFREAEIVQTELERATGDLAEEYTNLAESQALHLGFSDEEIKQGIIILNRFKLTSAEMQKAIPILEDYARSTGKTVPEAAQVLGSALLGNTRGLKKLGIDFEATGNVAADTATILGELEERVGGAADAYAQTSQGQIDRANQQWEEAKENFGEFVNDGLVPLIDGLPKVTKIAEDTGRGVGEFVDSLIDVPPAVHDASRTIHHFAGMAGKDLREWGKDVMESFRDVIFDLSNMDRHFDVTRKSFIKASKAMESRARDLAKAMKQISTEKWVNEDYIKFLSDQGPEWLVGFSKLTESEQRKAQKSWEETTKKTGEAKGSLDKVTGAIKNLGNQHSVAEVEVHYSWSGIDPGTLPGLASGKG